MKTVILMSLENLYEYTIIRSTYILIDIYLSVAIQCGSVLMAEMNASYSIFGCFDERILNYLLTLNMTKFFSKAC